MAMLEMDEGEDATAAIDMSGLSAPWDDLTGATITLSATNRATNTAMPLVDGSLDSAGSDGKVHSGFVQIPTTWGAGSYFCTLEVMKTGWRAPQKQSFDLKIAAVALKPS